jgi:hypothetical protein
MKHERNIKQNGINKPKKKSIIKERKKSYVISVIMNYIIHHYGIIKKHLKKIRPINH